MQIYDQQCIVVMCSIKDFKEHLIVDTFTFFSSEVLLYILQREMDVCERHYLSGYELAEKKYNIVIEFMS